MQSFRKESTTNRLGVRSIQSCSAHVATFEIKRLHPRTTQVIRGLNQRITALNSEIVLIFNINTKFNLLLNFLSNVFRLEICVHKFLARPVGRLYLSSLSHTYQQQISLKTTWLRRTLLFNLQGKLFDPHLRDRQVLVLHLTML